MSIFGRNRAKRAEVEKVIADLDEQAEQIDAQQTRVNAVTSWLESRKLNDGIGVDFEHTLLYPRRS